MHVRKLKKRLMITPLAKMSMNLLLGMTGGVDIELSSSDNYNFLLKEAYDDSSSTVVQDSKRR